MSGIEMFKGQFNRVRVSKQRFAILFPNQRSSPLQIFEQFFSRLEQQFELLVQWSSKDKIAEVARNP